MLNMHPFKAMAALTLSMLGVCNNAAHAETDTQSWNALAVAGPVKAESPWQYWFDGHLRYQDDAKDLGVSIFRPGIGYQVNADLSLWLGYARVTVDAGSRDIAEDRIWQQAIFPVTTVFGQTVTSRTRLEQRFRSDIDGDTAHRVRQFLRWAKPVSEQLSWVVWDEVFIGLNDADWGQRSGFDQNRFFVGPAWHLNSKWRIEAGYMHNYINSAGSSNRTNHNASLTLFGTW
jgi:hypothetical protein